MTTDLLWVVGGPPDGPDREELRYSIRSAVENCRFEYRDVVIVGDVPDWFTGVRIPLQPQPGKWDNQRASLATYVNHPGAADQIVLLNDDMYVTEPIDHIDVIRNRTPASRWAAGHGQHAATCWTCAVRSHAQWASNDLGRDIWLYENHAPLPFNVAALRDLLGRYPSHLPFMAGEAYAHAGAGGHGRTGGNAKVKATDSLPDKLALPIPYLSGNPDSWNGDLGAWVREQWPRGSRWERG